MILKRLIVLTVFAALAFGLGGEAHAQWVQTNGPYGGSVSCFAVSGTNSSSPMLFAGTNDGVFLTTNNGERWNAVSTGLPQSGVRAIAVIGTNLFAAADDSGVYLSTNNGATWTATDMTVLRTQIYITTLTVSGTDLFAGTYCGGVFLTTNNGASWARVNSGLADSSITALLASGTDLFTAIGSSCQTFTGPRGIFHSLDSGKSWKAANNGLTDYNVGAFAVSGTKLYAGMSGYGSAGGVYLSTDNGSTWTKPDTGLKTSVYAFAVSDPNSPSPLLFAGTDSGVFLSMNNGTSWKAANTGMTGIPVRSLAVIGTNLFAGTNTNGVFLSTDSGTSWSAVNTGLILNTVSALATDGVKLFAATQLQGGVFLSTDSGASWAISGTGLANEDISALAMSGANLFAGTSISSFVFHSTDYGTTWRGIDSGWWGGVNRVLAFAVSGTNLFAGTDQGVFLSSDTGKSWSYVAWGSNSPSYTTALLASGNILFAGGEGPWNQAYLSTNNGTSWTEDTAGLGVSYVNTFALIGSNLFAGTSYGGGVYLSTNNGTSWTASSNGLPYDSAHQYFYPVSALAVAPTLSGTNIFALAKAGYLSPGGIFLSTNNGTSWTSVSTGLESVAVNTIDVSGTNLYAGTVGNGVWRRPLSEMIPKSAVQQLPAAKTGLRTYPNPFSQSTTISFTPEASGYADVSIVNLLGVEVARIFSGELAAGEHTFTWDAQAGTHAPQGIYECLIRMNGRVETLPMLLR